MNKLFKSVAALITAMGLVFGLSACASDSLDMNKVTAVIDVRSVAEFQSGHLEGALNIDVESNGFATKIETLDKAGTFLLYCHSGRRAGLAKDQMTAAGFVNVTNLGGLSDAAGATGLPVVQ